MVSPDNFRIWLVYAQSIANKTVVHYVQLASISSTLPIGKKYPADQTPYM